MYIPDDKFLLVGGLERETAITSNRCFIIDDKGKVTYTAEMYVPRQYFAVATDYADDLVYVIGPEGCFTYFGSSRHNDASQLWRYEAEAACLAELDGR